MKYFLPVALAVLGAQCLTAQYKISPAGMQMIDNYREAVQRAHEGGDLHDGFTTQSAVTVPEVAVIVRLTDGADVTALEQAGYRITTDLGDMVIVSLPLDKVEQLAELECVKSVSFGEVMSPMLDFARPSGAVTSVQNGFTFNDATRSFDGSGVVVGMMDQGLEANHINFRGADGRSRIKRLWYMNSTNGTSIEYTDDDISAFRYDMNSESHATHVAGILGGSYRGPAKYFELSGPGGYSGQFYDNDGALPYYGVATGADLAFSVGTFQDANVVMGVDNIITYAEEMGQPVVVNLSLGSNVGPHDGTDDFTAALSRLGKRGIVCVSAGNEGEDNISIERKFTSLTKEVKTGLQDNKGSGYVDVWGSDNKPMTLTWSIYNTADRSTTPVVTIDASGQNKGTTSVTAFTQYFNGTISARSLVDPNNNRFRVYSTLNNVSAKSSTGNTRYIMLTVSGDAGQTAYIFGSKVEFARNNITGATGGTPANSINNLACGDDMISVGSYNSRITWPAFGTSGSGTAYQYAGSFELDAISPFSSYGTTFQGRKLPLVAAPGAAIISSYSSYYLTAGYESTSSMSASVAEGNRTYYWGRMQGTSMSCPFVAGTVGLWLQADPTMKYADIMEVINATSVKDMYVEDAPDRFGAGKLDALEGIKYILTNSAAVGSVFADDDTRLIVTRSGNVLTAYVAGATGVSATLYTTQGTMASKVEATGEEVTADLSALTPGVYVLTVDTAEGQRYSRKTVIR
ncbi:MAG: S8 family serine peptidase [Muribaculaceae bacterium]|nr:S8 family serine peptidase [Muribaculaceae bacterium]